MMAFRIPVHPSQLFAARGLPCFVATTRATIVQNEWTFNNNLQEIITNIWHFFFLSFYLIADSTEVHTGMMGSEASKRHDLVQNLNKQVRHLAESNKGSLPELRHTIWCWPPQAQEEHKDTFGRGFHHPPAKDSQPSGFDDEEEFSGKIPNTTLLPDAHAGSLSTTSLHCSAFGEPESSNWRFLGLDLKSEAEVYIELVVADLDPQFCQQCRKVFGDAGMLRPHGGVRICHDPMQKALADGLAQEDDNDDDDNRVGSQTSTFVVFGTYGSFPTDLNSQNSIVAGLAKNLIAPSKCFCVLPFIHSFNRLGFVGVDGVSELSWCTFLGAQTAFPRSWDDFRAQCPDAGDFAADGEGDDGDALPRWMGRMGQVCAP